MRRGMYYHYYVEGEDEVKLVNTLKTDLQLIVPGKVQKFNVVEQKLTKLRLRELKTGTTVVLVFDTDTNKITTLLENIRLLEKESIVKEVLCVSQVKNLEDELVRSCDIKQVRELTGSKSNKDYKRDMIKDSNFAQKLKNHKFDIGRFWDTVDENYREIGNDGYKIKK